MPNEIIVALISFAGTLCGTFAGIITSNRLINYRIEQLEKKVDKHNKLVEKMAATETSIALLQHRIDDIEDSLRG